MQIKYEVPPLWEKIREKFSLTENNPIFYTHGDVIYSPAKIAPSDDLLAHEFCHAEQQDHSEDVANIWWKQYLHDPDFRISQESEAYGANTALSAKSIRIGKCGQNIFITSPLPYQGRHTETAFRTAKRSN